MNKLPVILLVLSVFFFGVAILYPVGNIIPEMLFYTLLVFGSLTLALAGLVKKNTNKAR